MYPRHFQMFASYNRWANARLYDAAVKLGEEDFNRDVGAFFKSMCGTLNHVLVADRIWMRRFACDGPVHTKLDEVPYPAFAELRAAREAEDARIVAYANTLDDERLSGTFTYTPITDPREITQPLAPPLAHFFNHQTHHRGQAHTILTLLGEDAPPLDLIYYLRTEEGRAFG